MQNFKNISMLLVSIFICSIPGVSFSEGLYSLSSSVGTSISDDDQSRLVRLKEEATTRVDELSKIVFRNLRVNIPVGSTSQLITDSEVQKDTRVELWNGGVLVAVGCWDEETKTCYPGPCK
ncbi:MAG: hypothetical protein OEY58_16680 [Gammaproteobacteria bacterium]|nr:hypothetical protein [Gammaproteobacteria bacterium]